MIPSAAIWDYVSGCPVMEICYRHSLSTGSLYYALSRAGIPKRGYPKIVCNDFLFREETERGKYWLGFCSADAHVQIRPENSIRSLQLHLSRKDRCALEAFQKALETPHVIYDRVRKGGYASSALYVTSEVLTTDLLAFGAHTIKECNPTMVHHLIRGIFDGDGSVTCKDYVYSGTKTYHRQLSICGTRDVLEALADTVQKSAGTTSGCLRLSKGIHVWSLAGRHNIKHMADWLYADAKVWLKRKRQQFSSF